MKLLSCFLLALAVIMSTSFVSAQSAPELDVVLTLRLGSDQMQVSTLGGVPYSHMARSVTLLVSPVSKDGHTFLPLRDIIESLGGRIFWQQGIRSAFVRFREVEMVIPTNGTAIWVNNLLVDIGTESFLDAGRTMVPAPVLGLLGPTVAWRQEGETVQIGYTPNFPRCSAVPPGEGNFKLPSFVLYIFTYDAAALAQRMILRYAFEDGFVELVGTAVETAAESWACASDVLLAWNGRNAGIPLPFSPSTNIRLP